MRIDSLQLFQFRNYKDVQIQFNPEIIVLHGTNGAGKTNILESIYVGTIGKSHRTNDTSDMLMFNAEEAGIVVKFEKKDTPQKVNIKLSRQGPKDIRLNNTKISQKELIGTLNQLSSVLKIYSSSRELLRDVGDSSIWKYLRPALHIIIN